MLKLKKDLKCRIKNLFNKYKIGLQAMLLALGMSAAGLFVGNCPYPFWDKIDWLCLAENLVRSLFGDADDKDDAYFVNVGFDKQIVDIKINSTDIGRAVITDRKTLLDFLMIVERADYKYVFLDVRFEKGYTTEWDSALFSKIAGMKNIVFSHHYESPHINEESVGINGFEIADSQLVPKAAYNDYYTTIFSSNFTRYQYLQDSRPSVALRMYQDIDMKTIEQKGLLYFNDGKPCENCPYIPIKGTIGSSQGDGSAAKYYNLGPFLMEMPEEKLIEDMHGKIVVIGDFQEDLHDTYMGMQPGPYLTYLAYKYLSHGGNNVSIIVLVFMTLVFFFIVRGKLRGRMVFPWIKRLLEKKWMGWLRWLLKWRLIKFIGTFFTYSFVLSFICTIIYLLCGNTFNVSLPAMVITIISSIKETKKTEQYEKDNLTKSTAGNGHSSIC